MRRTREEQVVWRREYRRRWCREDVKKKRLAWVTENGPCRQCGSSERLEVDHIDPANKVHHAVWSWAPERRAAELAKCQVLCHRCHREKSIAYLRRPIRHGTHTGYSYYDCRCDDCRAAHTQYERTRREKRRGIAQSSRAPDP